MQLCVAFSEQWPGASPTCNLFVWIPAGLTFSRNLTLYHLGQTAALLKRRCGHKSAAAERGRLSVLHSKPSHLLMSQLFNLKINSVTLNFTTVQLTVVDCYF